MTAKTAKKKAIAPKAKAKKKAIAPKVKARSKAIVPKAKAKKKAIAPKKKPAPRAAKPRAAAPRYPFVAVDVREAYSGEIAALLFASGASGIEERDDQTLRKGPGQGSVTVVGAFASPETLGCHPVYLALTIGCASKLVPWMNDSGFWVVSKTAGLSERETLRTMTVMFSLMGIVGFCAVLVAAKLFPMV